ncbi:MAG: DUF4442 domain-containing protein [Zetaproteobacteria bacterium]|nr:DUF4442 domain-containing protein [Zetaproteobacteria bacterium]
MRLTPERTLKLISFWPPFLVSGVRVRQFDLDAGYIVSELRTTRRNANYFGTHFGGSLFAMCDPFYVFLLMHKLGRDYYVWDLRSTIEFRKATSLPVTARFAVTAAQLEEIRAAAQGGQRVEPCFTVDVVDPEQNVIASVTKILYVKKKKSVS